MSDSIAYFDRIAGSYTDWTTRSRDLNFRERLEVFGQLIDRLRRDAPTNLAVDLGCGNGELTQQLCAAGFRVVGIDGSREMLGQAQSLLGEAGDFELRHEPLPLRPEVVSEFRTSVGVLVASSVVEYLSDDTLFLQQCRALLAPGGWALVSFANASSWYRKFERALGPRGPQRGKIIEVQQRQHSRRDVEELARSAGLEVADMRYFGLPVRRQVGWRFRGRPAWLATMLLARFGSPDSSHGV